MQTYQDTFTIRHYEVGEDSKLRLATIANFMEEVAGHHAKALGVGVEQLGAYNLSWAMTKMRILPLALPAEGQTIGISTGPTAQVRQNYRRDFLFHTPEGLPLVKAITWWVVFDLENRKLSELPPGHCLPAPVFLPNGPTQQEGDIRIPPLRNPQEGPAFPVRLADIDRNKHVNNVRYLDFILEAAAPFVQPNTPLCQIDLIFRAEGRMGETLQTATVPEQNTPFLLLHSIHRGETELLRARTVWGERP